MKPLDLNLLDQFRTAGRLQHVTRAAEVLGVSQPALSRSMAKLEANIGAPLFQRAGRSVRLTRFGEILLARTERALREIEEAQQEIADLSGLDRGVIAIGFLRSLGVQFVPQLVRRFSARHPGITFSFAPNNSATLEDHLDRGDLDLIFMAAPVTRPTLQWTQVAAQDLVLIVAKSHRLAQRREIALSDVAREPFVTFKPGQALRRLTDELCAAAGFTPTISYEGDDSSTVPGFVAAGFGVAIVPPESGVFPGVVSLRIKSPKARRRIGIAWGADRYLSAAVRAFRDFAVTKQARGKA
jgi:DNA-binding transcriptional LysR family regulator